MKQAARWLLSNLPLMVMAIVLAALAWFVALDNADPTVERGFPQPIPITFTGPAEDMLIVGTSDEYVQVTVRTTQSVWESLAPEDFDVTADMTTLDPGVHEVPVSYGLEKQPSKIVAVDPKMVVVQLDSSASRIVPVRVATEGKPALGYVPRARVLDPRDVTVKGPTSYVTRVVEAFATLSIQNSEEDVEETLTLRPRDSEGDSVPYVSLTPETVDVLIPIEPSGYHSSLAVKAVLTGEVSSGYRVTDISIDPPTVTVFGNPDDLAALEQGFIETKPVNVDGAQEDVTVRPGLSVPPKVTVVPGEEVEVQVFVEAIQSSLTITSTPQIQGLEPGYTATVSPDIVEVILSGPLSKLESLSSDDVRVVLDLFEYPLGTHQIVPEVVTPEDITSQSLIPETVQVRISEAPTPTPRVQSTITATMTATITSTTTITDQ
ncbi:MAG: CdaR family protein [Anaerolineae bacterium]